MWNEYQFLTDKDLFEPMVCKNMCEICCEDCSDNIQVIKEDSDNE